MEESGEEPAGAGWQFSNNWEIRQDKIPPLRELLFHITQVPGGYSPQKIRAALLSYARDGYVPSHDMISRFLNSKGDHKAKKPDSYILLVYFLGRLRKEKRHLFGNIHSHTYLEQFAAYCEQYFEDRSTDIKFRDRYIVRQSFNRAARSSGAASELIAIINSLALPEDSIFGTDRLVFSANDGSRSYSTEMERRYLTYRYGIEPNFIFKSFTTLSKKRIANSPVLFKNRAKDRFGNSRSISGFGLNLGTKLYLIGNLDEGSALEVIAFSHFNASRSLLAGLAMTVSAGAELLVTRIVFKKIVDFPNDLELGRKPYEFLKNEVGGFAEMLANKIDFDLTRPIKYDGRPISQNAMVEEVSRLLRNQSGHPRLTYEDGTEFNPASSKQYTFNAALREFR